MKILFKCIKVDKVDARYEWREALEGVNFEHITGKFVDFHKFANKSDSDAYQMLRYGSIQEGCENFEYVFFGQGKEYFEEVRQIEDGDLIYLAKYSNECVYVDKDYLDSTCMKNLLDGERIATLEEAEAYFNKEPKCVVREHEHVQWTNHRILKGLPTLK